MNKGRFLLVIQKNILNLFLSYRKSWILHYFSSKTRIKGKLRQLVVYWDRVGVNKTISKIISNLQINIQIFAEQEIMELVNTGRVKEVQNVPYIVNTLCS